MADPLGRKAKVQLHEIVHEDNRVYPAVCLLHELEYLDQCLVEEFWCLLDKGLYTYAGQLHDLLLLILDQGHRKLVQLLVRQEKNLLVTEVENKLACR